MHYWQNCAPCGCIEPYNDDYMIFDESTRHYVLTENAIVERCAIDIRARLSDNKTVNPEIVINKLCRTISDEIYEYLHRYSIHNDRQDFMIATNAKLRTVIQRAMEYQADYFLANGDIFLSLDGNERGKEINEMTKRILLNSGICYTGL